MSFHLLPEIENPFENCSTTDELWSLLASKMRGHGFNSQIVFTFTYTPVRNRSGIHKEVPAIVPERFLIVGNNLIYMADTPFNVEEYSDYLIENNLLVKDPVAYHAREYGTVALLGKDFLSPEMSNYDDAVAFWNQPEKFKIRNCLCVPLHQNSPWTPHGFGLHSTLPGEEFKDLIKDKGERILLDCYQYTAKFNILFRQEFAQERGITKRQYEVLKLVCQGLSNTEIASMLGLTEASVSFHLKAVKERLQVISNRELPMVASRLGFIDLG